MFILTVPWTFMSETLATHHRIVERLSRHNNLRFDKFSWPSDGHECPSYCSLFLVHGTCLCSSIGGCGTPLGFGVIPICLPGVRRNAATPGFVVKPFQG